MKLIKLKTDHYIIVDDSEIKEGDWYYWEVTKTIQIAKLDSLNRLPKSSDGSKKITHSTQPESLGMGWMQSVQPIFLSEVKELIGEVDVEKKADGYCSDKWEYAKEENKQSFIDGYYQALEDNKEKKWTDEDVINIVDNVSQNWFRCYSHNDKKEHLSKITKDLQKTEWEVEFINGKLKLK